jgi:hypothetical protein
MHSSSFDIVPCDFQDMAECVEVFNEAFADDPHLPYLYPNSDSKVLKERDLAMYESSYKEPATRYFKAVKKVSRYVYFIAMVLSCKPSGWESIDPTDSATKPCNSMLILEFTIVRLLASASGNILIFLMPMPKIQRSC